ncbi:MAG: glycosyltransferase [Flavobacteriaceae bacterium]|nr:glycosyltransferase [Flavobacteriaceae bacterium]
MKILFVSQQYIHAARWINQLKDLGHDIYVFDCLDAPIHEDLKWTNFTTGWQKRKIKRLKGEDWLKKHFPKLFYFIESLLKVTASEKLAQIITEIKPDVIQSFEMQSQSYPLLKTIKKGKNFKWIYACWGSDLYLYQNDKNHLPKIKDVLKHADYAFFDCNRDAQLAKKLGFKGTVLGVFPGGGGYNLKELQIFSQPISERRSIIIKGYHHWAGRALNALEAIEELTDEIKEYDIYVYSAHPIVVDKIKAIKNAHPLNISYSTRAHQLPHLELIKKFGQAKIALAISITDGIPNTLLESIIMEAFPIQTNPGGATEDYIIDGKNGLLIDDYNDVAAIKTAILKALNNPQLLEEAYKINRVIATKLEVSNIKKDVLNAYKSVVL